MRYSYYLPVAGEVRLVRRFVIWEDLPTSDIGSEREARFFEFAWIVKRFHSILGWKRERWATPLEVAMYQLAKADSARDAGKLTLD